MKFAHINGKRISFGDENLGSTSKTKAVLQYNSHTKTITIFCKKCQTEIRFNIPGTILEGKENFPFPYQYVHGSPPHSITIYLDKDLKIRGTELGDTLSISNSALDSLANEIEKNSPEFKIQILRTWLKGFITISNSLSQDGKYILFQVGKRIGEADFALLPPILSN